MADLLVILRAINKAAEVSIPRTPLHDIFMIQRLGLADSISIVAILELELHDWALKHMKNKSQAQKRSKWVCIPVAFIAQIVWKDDFMKAYHSKTKDIPHLESLEYANLRDVWWSHGLEVLSWCHEHPSDAWVYSESEETGIYTTEMIEKLSETDWWTPCPWFIDYPEEKCPTNEIDLKKGKKSKGKEKMLDVEESRLPSTRGKRRGKELEPKQHKKSPSKKRKTQEDMEEDLEEDLEDALEEIHNTQQVEEGAPQEQAISKLHIESPKSESTHPLDQEILSAFTPGVIVSRTSPLVPAWNEMKLDLIEAATTLAEEYLLDNGTFVATLQGVLVTWLTFVEKRALHSSVFYTLISVESFGAKSSHPTGEPSTKATDAASLDSQQADCDGAPRGSPPKNTAGKVTVILSVVQVRKAQVDLEGRALIGMIADPRPSIEELRGWIKNHWGSIGAEVETVQALPKTQWNKDYNPEKDALNRFPIWVEFPNLPLHYHNHLRVIGSALGKVLGGRARRDFIPSWHPQALIEMDISKELPTSITIALDVGECFEQPIVYKYLPNACFHCGFHCGAKGHFVRDCPVKNPQIPKSNQGISNRVPPSTEGNAQSRKPPPPQNTNRNRFQRASESKNLPKRANRFALLTTLPEWEDSKVPDSSCGASEDEEDTSSKLEKQVQDFDNEMVLEMSKTCVEGSENKENEAPLSMKGSDRAPMETQKDNKRGHTAVANSPKASQAKTNPKQLLKEQDNHS
ncbi:hypothetical protein L7F22_015400 [Adiantum nelumboides]|nr:hypothetical protein [Adiantum nelumboides]